MKKKSETNIEKLQSQRRLNVQEQIILAKDRIMSEAKHWRDHGIPLPIQDLFKEKGVDYSKSIILKYEQDFPGMSTDEGIVLTSDGRFYEFDIDLNADRAKLIELYSWKDVTDNYEIADHKKGIGKTYGLLAIEVLHEMNGNM